METRSISFQSISSRITTLFQRASGTSKVEYHWQLLLIGFVILMVSIFAFSLYFFLGINRGDLFIVNASDPLPIDTIDRSALQKTLSAFEDQQVLFEEYQKEGVDIDDPSQ